MADKFISKRNLKFLLFEVFDCGSLCEFEYYAEHNRKAFDMILEEAIKLAANMFYPILQEMDRQQPELIDGRVKVHPGVRTLMNACGEGGWIASQFPFEFDGEQMPLMISSACRFIFSAANYSASVYPELTAGAAHLITSFGSPGLVETYVPNMLSGKWQGTMALTEPQAGSSLSDITTSADPDPAGFYRVQGQKIFISCGDHDGVDNVIHLMLAKIKGAPAGVKGISLFVVPKLRIDEAGDLVGNDLQVSQIYHKLGYRGSPITELSIGEQGDCHGYLVGEPHKGLAYMFQMMNEARLGVGLGATAIASAAYYASLNYAKERPQGRTLGQKDPSRPQVPIIKHADVRRMLLFQRAVVEGSLAVILQCCKYADQALVLSGDQKHRVELLLDILTPVAKTYPSEMGIWSVSQGLQCFGGYGYCEDFPIEQYFRDARIHPIHEGTTGIQGLDLLGRKVTMQDGQAFMFYIAEVKAAIDTARTIRNLQPYADRLDDALTLQQEVTLHLTSLAQEKGPQVFLADATLYLEFFGIIAVAWQWLKQAIVVQKVLDTELSASEASFYRGKYSTFRYFYAYELPKTSGLAQRLIDDDRVTLEMQIDDFKD